MHLKRLEAFGFKSFADKVLFDFEPGVTCLVGPNGCGKSNVVDAIKWVLGEQSAKSLRGDEMLDVIFSGSASRKPLNFAEVTLTFDNASGTLPLNAPEVSVTRRLFRSGESEYLINKGLCRLRDVRELFWDTGVGTSSYSVIEQGRIASLLEANSKDRRVLFEEAAGIHKYKERKKIALRKLERVEQNLARLNDLLTEVERNLKTVTRQAEKARKAKEITDKLRQTRLEILLHDTHTSNLALQEVTASLDAANTRANALAAELAQAQAQTLTQQKVAGHLDLRLTEAQAMLAEARARLQRLEAESEAARQSIGELATEAQRAKEISQAAGQRAASLAQERERVELDSARAQESSAERTAKAAALSKAAAEAQLERERLSQALELARRAAVDALGRRSLLQDTLVRAEAELNGLEYRVRKSQAQMDKAVDQLAFAQAEAEEVRARMHEFSQRREVLEAEQLALRNQQTRAEDELDRLTRQADEVHRERETRRSRLVALEGLRDSGEGLNPGPRAVLTSLRHELKLEAEVHGLVADCVAVPARLERAIEAALGERIETLVVATTPAAQQLASALAERELGRATFLPLDALVSTPGAANPVAPYIAATPGLTGRASDLVTCEAVYRPVVQALLGRVLVFETQAQAMRAVRNGAGRMGYDCVSLGGEYFEVSGSFSGGRYKAQRLGLIGRKNELSRLRVELDELDFRVTALSERAAFIEKRAQQLARDEERINQDLAAIAQSFAEQKSMLVAVEREEARSTDEKNLAVQEITALGAEQRAHTERVSGMRTELEVSQKAETQTAAAVTSRQTELAQSDERLQECRRTLAEVERDAATWRERVAALQRELTSLSAQFAERRDEADREQRRAEALTGRKDQAEATLAEKTGQLKELHELIETLTQQTAALQAHKEAVSADLDALRGKERERATELEQVRQELAEIREREVNLRVRLENKIEQTRSDFQLDALAELARLGGPPEVAPQALEAVHQLEERLNRLGPVNMFALEELQELQQRYDFLKVQFDDLQSARNSLRDVIARINRRSRTLFQETFEKVKENFNDIFRKLFGGGRADLLLEEGEDILEAGIEIIAKPPGKAASVSQLSGGEKTMTMIALLFAVFRSRPAPFCILDEVDAPLDEANVERFNLIVREFLDRSQFVVITHNRKTMSHGDILYGVTMPEPGVSKRLALKFSEIEKTLPMDEIERQAREARAKAQASAAQAQPAPEAVENAVAEQVTATAAGN